MKKILITGITGQDGIFLSKIIKLNEPSTKIYGITRNLNSSIFENHLSSVGVENTDNIKLLEIDLQNYYEINKLISDIKPSIVFNLAGPSSVYKSLIIPNMEHEIINIFNNLTNSLIENKNFTPLFQASSSEMFENSTNKLNEKSKLNPKSPYAKGKLYCHEKSIKLREKYDWPIVSGILFNHESQFRTKEFLFSKIVDSVIGILNKEVQSLTIGSLDLERDWSYAEDIVEGFYQVTNYGDSHSYVIGSGKSTSIEEVIKIAFSYFNLNYKDYVQVNPELLRKGDPKKIAADISKIKKELNWNPKVTLKKLVEIIIESRIKEFKL